MIGSLCTWIKYWKAPDGDGKVIRYGSFCGQAAPYLVEGNSFCSDHAGHGIDPTVTWVDQEETNGLESGPVSEDRIIESGTSSIEMGFT